LEYVEYDKDQAKEVIKKEFAWRDYGGKHYESIFTRFYQGYVLKEKFGYDKRKAHLSNLICSGQITKNEALIEIQKNPYASELQLEEDKEFVLKKLGLTEEKFNELMKSPVKSHLEYNSYETGLYPKHAKFMKAISGMTKLIKKLRSS
jgi:hypothetical protein